MSQELVASILANLGILLGVFLTAIKPYIKQAAEEKVKSAISRDIEHYKKELQKDLEKYKNELVERMEIHKSHLKREEEEFKDRLLISKDIREKFFRVNDEFMEILLDLRSSLHDFYIAQNPSNLDEKKLEEASIRLSQSIGKFDKFAKVHYRPYLKKWGREINFLISSFNHLVNDATAYTQGGELQDVGQAYEEVIKTVEFLQEFIFSGINESINSAFVQNRAS